MSEQSALPGHGAGTLTAVTVDAYNAELKSGDGYLGDRASNRAFKQILEAWREKMREAGRDPLGDAQKLSRRHLDKLLAEGDVEAAGLVHGAVEEFSQSFAEVVRRLMKLKDWKDTQRIVVGGGLSGSRIGEIAIGRTAVLLKSEGIAVDLQPIRHHPDHAGLIGAAHLAPPWIFKGHSALLAVDVGGSNIRCGLVLPHADRAKTLAEAEVKNLELWRHADEKPGRDAAIRRLCEMLNDLVGKAAQRKLVLAPFIGIGCPGRVEHDGSIAQGAQNLPGNWESSRFNLPREVVKMVGEIDGHEPLVVMHNDAVVQGLSQIPFNQDVQHWGVLTIGTGLGNARFTNRS